MIVLDTHVWIWWNSAPDELSPPAREAIDRAGRVGICPISCWEIATKVAQGRLGLDRDVRSWVAQALGHPRVELVPLSAEIAVTAGLLGLDGFHGDPADRLIASTALTLGVGLATKDRLIRDFPRIHAVW